MPFKVERGSEADRDLESIFDFLIESYVHFGEPLPDAIDRAAKRMKAIEAAMRSLGDAPHQGAARDDVAKGLRSVTKERAIFYFDIDDGAEVVRVVAVFYGGQDHQRIMLQRIMSDG
jgi:toxin ParE1/3/4